MPSHRKDRAGTFIQEELTGMLMGAVRDPRVQSLTITGVDLTPDRRLARVYVACYDGEEALKQGLEGLESCKGFLRRELARLLHWQFTPELEFRVDRSLEYGNRIETLLNSLKKDEAESADDDDSTE